MGRDSKVQMVDFTVAQRVAICFAAGVIGAVQAELAALAKEAHEKICPYSHATRGNVDVQLEIVGS